MNRHLKATGNQARIMLGVMGAGWAQLRAAPQRPGSPAPRERGGDPMVAEALGNTSGSVLKAACGCGDRQAGEGGCGCLCAEALCG
jgi:hypothetical protein